MSILYRIIKKVCKKILMKGILSIFNFIVSIKYNIIKTNFVRYFFQNFLHKTNLPHIQDNSGFFILLNLKNLNFFLKLKTLFLQSLFLFTSFDIFCYLSLINSNFFSFWLISFVFIFS